MDSIPGQGNSSDKFNYEEVNYNNRNKKVVYNYPLALYKQPTLFEKFKERVILAGKPRIKKPLINKNYHHLSFKSHSDILILNPYINKSPNMSYNNNDTNTQSKTYYKTFHNSFNQRIKEENPNGKTIYNTKNGRKNNKLILPKYYAINHNIYQKIYLSEVEKRGFNYNKIRIAMKKREVLNSLNSYSRYENEYGPLENKKVFFVLEPNQRDFFPKSKKFLYKKQDTDDDISLKYLRYHKSRSIINIKKDGKFKFHVYHDRKGRIKELDKRSERTYKSTMEKLRDMKLLARIIKLKEPETIQMFKDKIHKGI